MYHAARGIPYQSIQCRHDTRAWHIPILTHGTNVMPTQIVYHLSIQGVPHHISKVPKIPIPRLKKLPILVRLAYDTVPLLLTCSGVFCPIENIWNYCLLAFLNNIKWYWYITYNYMQGRKFIYSFKIKKKRR